MRKGDGNGIYSKRCVAKDDTIGFMRNRFYGDFGCDRCKTQEAGL